MQFVLVWFVLVQLVFHVACFSVVCLSVACFSVVYFGIVCFRINSRFNFQINFIFSGKKNEIFDPPTFCVVHSAQVEKDLQCLPLRSHHCTLVPG